VQAVAVRDGKIVATGSNAKVLKLKGAGTQLIDAHGKTVIPGRSASTPPTARASSATWQ
jgi:predicted amidohydrolase YtcJ